VLHVVAGTVTFVLAGAIRVVNVDPTHAPRCEGVTVRVITASSEPDWSLTVLASSDAPRNRLLRRGGAIGRKTVHFVGWDRVWLREGAALCQVGLYDGGGEAPKPSATSARASTTRARPWP